MRWTKKYLSNTQPLKKSSKNRLTPQQESLFPGDTLFAKIARAVCRAGTLPRKELYETWEVAKRVRRRYRGGRVLDLACGHGLLAHIMLILDDSSEIAIAVDKNIPVNAGNLSNTMISAWPRLQNRIIYKNIAIEKVEVEPDDIVVSAHACGTLTDLIIAKATDKRARIAVLPCCHDLRQSPTCGLEGWMDKTLAVDTVRAVELRAKGYKIITQNIPDEITPKNRLLMGEYKGDLTD
jgi:SAM-dependent methyltransferase